jgi:hypothetical protein
MMKKKKRKKSRLRQPSLEGEEEGAIIMRAGNDDLQSIRARLGCRVFPARGLSRMLNGNSAMIY